MSLEMETVIFNAICYALNVNKKKKKKTLMVQILELL